MSAMSTQAQAAYTPSLASPDALNTSFANLVTGKLEPTDELATPHRRERAISAAWYYIAHSIPGRARLRPLTGSFEPNGQRLIPRTKLIKFAENLPEGISLKICSKTDSLLFITTSTAEDSASSEISVRNPIPGRIASYFYPSPLRFVLAIWHSLPYILRGLKIMIKRHALTLDVLDGAALAVCLLQRDFRSLGAISFFFALGEYLSAWTRQKSRAALAESLSLKLETVWIESDAEELEIPLARLNTGDIVIVRAGSIIPVDGIVTKGEGMVNQAMLTGEALPVLRTGNNSVYAGTVITEGLLKIRALKVGGATRINSILRYIEESEDAKASIQSRYEKTADAVVPYNFLLSGLVYLLTRNIRRAASVLLVDYSCAIRLATPLTILTAMREAAEHGMLIKGGKFVEALAQADAVVFDKTGTLTEAKPIVVDVVSFDDQLDARDILKIAACLEEHFPHPVGLAVVRAAEKAGLSHREEHAEVEFIVAHGIASRLQNKRVLLGSEHFLLEDCKIPLTEEQHTLINKQTELGRSVLYLAINGCLSGVILIEDNVRSNAASVVEKLRADGVKRIIMLTGDGEATARAVSALAGVDEFHARMLPEQKAAFITQLRAEGYTVLMLGDGVNDSPALSAANVGCAMCDGADMAKEIADIVLTSGNLEDIPLVRTLCQRSLQRVGSSFKASLFWNSIFLLGGLSGTISAGVSAFLHNTATSAIAVRSMRPLLEIEESQTRDC